MTYDDNGNATYYYTDFGNPNSTIRPSFTRTLKSPLQKHPQPSSLSTQSSRCRVTPTDSPVIIQPQRQILLPLMCRSNGDPTATPKSHIAKQCSYQITAILDRRIEIRTQYANVKGINCESIQLSPPRNRTTTTGTSTIWYDTAKATLTSTYGR